MLIITPIATIVFYVLLSMAVNVSFQFVVCFKFNFQLGVWIFVYEMECSNYMFLDHGAIFSSGDGVLDGMVYKIPILFITEKCFQINALFLLAIVAFISFALIACILYKFHRVVVFYIQISFVFLVYTFPVMTIK